MALKIERNGTGFRITSPDDRVARVRAYAKTTAECGTALAHYFDGLHVAQREDCPICRQIAATNERKAR